ncbi:recombination protein NinG [Sulfurovum sp.]|uniref:recombination protein NinG n=1 Tax=Sulfurovum sp. TaxID=1969726 RepID=UPI003567CB53
MRKKKCKAKGCSAKFTPVSSLQAACSVKCAMLLVNEKNDAKRKRKAKADTLKLEAIQPLSYWVKKAQAACNAFIRERDKGDPCISCGRYHTGQYHAGHYISTGARRELRFHPANIHKQCQPCNTHLSGNPILYRSWLIKKVGQEMVEYLENYNGIQKMTVDEIKDIEAHYKELLKSLR